MLLRRVCVFCGSSPGRSPDFRDAAERLAREMVARHIGLVFGGGCVGLMGIVADAVLAAGGHAIGVIPHALVAREIAHRGLQDLRIVTSMHERKAMMAELSDAFVALPGGYGTFEEFFEIVTWTQLGLHRKRCGLLNVNGWIGWPSRPLGPIRPPSGRRKRRSLQRRLKGFEDKSEKQGGGFGAER
jgi:uncharacterized protein (TIGR00730 family)